MFVNKTFHHCQSNIPKEENSSSSDNVQPSSVLPSRYTVSEEHLKAKEQFLEKERENARMEAKRRKLMEKRVRIHAVEFSVNGGFHSSLD